MLADIDNFIIFIFFFATLILGLRHGFGIKTLSEYATGGKKFSDFALVATTVATWASGSGFFITISKTYSDGLFYLIASSMLSVQLIIMAFLIAPRMAKFLQDNTVAETMGNLYGPTVQVITGIIGTIGAIGFIVIQFQVFGKIINYFGGIPYNYSVISAGLIVILYSALGGIRAVTFTDILQFITFSIALPVIGYIIWKKVSISPAYSTVFANFSVPKFNIFNVVNTDNPKFYDMLPLLFYFLIPTMPPALYQRMILSNNIFQIKKVCAISAILLLVIKLLMAWIPFVVYSINSHIEVKKLLPHIIENYTFIGLKGLVITGVIAMAMSTADSNLNISAVLFANDICKPLKLKDNLKLKISKIFSVIIGLTAIYIALMDLDLLKIILTANSYYMPIVTVPLIASILGLRTNTASVLLSMFAGALFMFLWKYYKIKFNGIVLAMLANLVVLLLSSFVFFIIKKYKTNKI